MAPAEQMIPAFAVVKGGVVLKDVFLNAPPETLRGGGGGGDDEEHEDPPVLIGRHPDCHVVVDHPSISRFHLEVRSRRRQRHLTVTDLSSVHGTWVSGRRIPPNMPVDLADGDTLWLGASRREYRLHWLSLREAFEMEDPLPPLQEEDKECRAHQEPSRYFVADESDSLDLEVQQDTNCCVDFNFWGKNCALNCSNQIRQPVVEEQNEFCTKEVPLAPPLPQFTYSLFQEEPSLLQFKEDGEGVTKEELVDENSKFSAIPPISDIVGSSLLKEPEKNKPEVVPVPVLNAEAAVQSDIWNTLDVKEAEEKEEIIAQDKDTTSYVSGEIIMEKSQEGLGPSIYKELMHPISPLNLEHHPSSDTKNSMSSIAKETKPHEFLSENHMPQVSVDAKLPKSHNELMHYISPQDLEDDVFPDKKKSVLGDVMDIEPISKSHIMQDAIDGNTKTRDMKCDAMCTLNFDSSIFSDGENAAQSQNAVGSENSEKENTICRILFDNLDLKDAEEKEEAIAADREVAAPDNLERSQEGLEHDTFSDKGNSVLNIVKETGPNEFTSASHIPRVAFDAKLQIKQIEFMNANSPLDFDDDVYLGKNLTQDVVMDMKLAEPNSENHLMQEAIGINEDMRCDTMSPLRLDGDTISDRNGTPCASRELKPNKSIPAISSSKSKSGKLIGLRKDIFMSGEPSSHTSNKECQKGEQNKLSAKSKGFDIAEHTFCSDNDNLTPISSGVMKVRRHLPNSLMMVDDQDKDAFYSDKENMTPVSSAAQKSRDMSESHKRIEREIKKKRVEDRVPFEALLASLPLSCTNSFDHNQANVRAADFAAVGSVVMLEGEPSDPLNEVPDRVREHKKVWTMVTDTDCLLDDKLRKSIMLLQGIKGTRLIIPRIVIRELDCLKRREGLFRRSSSKASSILQWIEDCMEMTSCWMHVQTSFEMSQAAPTPLATPTQRSDEESESAANTFDPFTSSSRRSSTDSASPTSEDHILDCALLFSKLRRNEGIVILSNSITLKIKAMANGMLCEEPKEFRESLTNPCSSRFMWAASAPRGPAWSCLDKAVLAENYYNSHNASRRRPWFVHAAKGLKLILLLHSSLNVQVTNNVTEATLT